MKAPMQRQSRQSAQVHDRTSRGPHRASSSPVSAIESEIANSPLVVAQRRALGAAVGAPSGDGAAGGQSEGLPPALLQGIESLSGMNLSDVHVHRNSTKPAQMGAWALAQTNAIHLAPGQEKHLPHEAWHIVQQRQGRVKRTLQQKGVDINDEPQLEKEATRMGDQALRGQDTAPWTQSGSPHLSAISAPSGGNGPIVQRVLRTVHSKTHTRGDDLVTKRQKYNAGDTVDVDESQVYQDERGNAVWYKLSDKSGYIRAGKLAFSTYVTKGSSKEQEAKLDAKDVASVNAMFAKKDFDVSVKGKKTKVSMPAIEGRDAQIAKGFMSPDELALVHRLEQTPEGRHFLAHKGFLNEAQVDKWARSPHIAGMWERYEEHGYIGPIPTVSGAPVLTHLQRLQIATRQRDLGISNEAYRNTPGYVRYQGQQIREDVPKEIREQFRRDIYDRDTEIWKDTFNSQTRDEKGGFVKDGERTEHALNIMRRMFLVLHDGLKYRDKKDEPLNKDWMEDVSVAMSHGGRVMVKLPAMTSKGDDNHAFINWLLGNDSGEKERPNKTKSHDTEYHKAGVDTRIASSHSIKITKDEFTEEKGNTLRETHFGMDLPLGGLGKRDVAGGVILPDGRHGHLYAYYKAATADTPGGVLFGLETSRAGHTDMFGQYHDLRGAPAEFSSLGTAKAARIGEEINGRMVDYAGRAQKDKNGYSWLDQLKLAEQNLQMGLVSTAELVGKVNRDTIFDPLLALKRHEEKG